MKPIIISCFCLLFILDLYSQPKKALEFYKDSNFEAALNEWNILLHAGAKGEDLYYNIATSYLQLENYPKAILFYNKALKWNPHCKSCHQNLRIARNKAGVDNFEIPEFFLKRFWHSILFLIQPFYWFIGFCVFLSIGIACNLFFNYLPEFLKKRNSIYLVYFIGFVFFIFAWEGDATRNESKQLIIMQVSKLYSSPDQNSESKLDLPAGQSARFVDQIKDWIKIETPELDLGWVEKSSVEFISL
ncbi:MAG: tetratricopeptide repeat protein [Saprospiraceae bacterium]|nr:tetratricopeptide repeat protein [Saprospiraceae bacterium]